MKTGLVLEGGGMRGMYTAGVLDVMLENNIGCDVIFGVSAGAVFGCNYKSRQIGRTIRYNKRFCKNPRYSSVLSFLFTGNYFGAKFCYTDIPYKYDVFDSETFKNSPEKFFVVCTDIVTGKSVYKELLDSKQIDFEWMRASASMPLVSKIVEIDGQKMLDGGMSDSIPLQASLNMGCDKHIVILTQVEGYQKKPNKMIPLFKACYRKYPAVAPLMENRHIMYNNELCLVDEHKKAGDTFVIRPSRFIKIGRTEHNPNVLEEMYQLGRSDMLEKLTELKAFCN